VLYYEAALIALLVDEEAGGAASDGQRRILELEPTHIHARTIRSSPARRRISPSSSSRTAMHMQQAGEFDYKN
jgi:fructose-1,6-bisphosphatase